MYDTEFAKEFKEEIELDEMKWAVGGVYHQEFKNGDKAYFRADSVQKNKRWKGMQVDEFGGKQKKAKNATANENLPGWATTPKNEIPKGLKEEVEIDEDTLIPNRGRGTTGTLPRGTTLSKLHKEYLRNEKKNEHTENYKLLAAAFGTREEVAKIAKIQRKSEEQGHTSKSDMDWMYKNINPYYDKIRNEEVKMDEAKGTAYPPTIENLRMIVKDKQHQKFMFDKGQAIVDTFTASAMIAVYDAMKKPEIKKKFEEMIKSKEGFMKTQAFAMKMIK